MIRKHFVSNDLFVEIWIGNDLSKGNYVFPYTGPLLFLQPDLNIPDVGSISAFKIFATHAINSRTKKVVRPLHFVLFRPVENTTSSFKIVATKVVPDLSEGLLTVSACAQFLLFNK